MAKKIQSKVAGEKTGYKKIKGLIQIMESFSDEFLGIPNVIWKGIFFLIVCVAIYYGWKRNKDDV